MRVTLEAASAKNVELLGQIHSACWRQAYHGIMPAGYPEMASPERWTARYQKTAWTKP